MSARQSAVSTVPVGFRHWLGQRCGLCEKTVAAHLTYAGDLMALFDAGIEELDAVRVRRALFLRTEGLSPPTVGKVATSLRYLAFAGLCPASLEDAVPRAPVRRLAALPQYISSEDVERTIAACGAGRPAGMRDRAIILLLARLALRAGDIVGLRLGDIDFRNAQVKVSGKSRRGNGPSAAAGCRRCAGRVPSLGSPVTARTMFHALSTETGPPQGDANTQGQLVFRCCAAMTARTGDASQVVRGPVLLSGNTAQSP